MTKLKKDGLSLLPDCCFFSSFALTKVADHCLEDGGLGSDYREKECLYFEGWCRLFASDGPPVRNPLEDLKQRLVAAAEEQLAKGFLAPLAQARQKPP